MPQIQIVPERERERYTEREIHMERERERDRLGLTLSHLVSWYIQELCAHRDKW